MTRRRKSLPDVERREVEVRADVERLGRLRVAEQEELDLGPDVERQAQIARARHRPPQDRARVALEERALRRADVAEHARDARHTRPPRQDLERGRVGVRDHVGLLHPGEPVDGRSVEPDAFAERFLQLLRRDGERLQEPQDVGEPQPDEPDLAFLGRADDECTNVVVHRSSPCPWPCRLPGSPAGPTNVAARRFPGMTSRLRTRYGCLSGAVHGRAPRSIRDMGLERGSLLADTSSRGGAGAAPIAISSTTGSPSSSSTPHVPSSPG